MQPTLLILAAGMGSRYGGLKQLDPVGPAGETLLDYAVFDAIRSGFGRIVFIIRRDFEEQFRTQVGSRYAGRIAVDYAYQALTDLPRGFAPPEGRVKPWGTGHAVWCAREVVKEPFAVINADDFYGRDAFAQLAAFLTKTTGATKPQFAMVGYPLGNTVSEHGAVSRGVCRTSPDGRLQSVVEHTSIHAQDLDRPDGLSSSTIVSMNCWGFQPSLFPALEAYLLQFLKVHAADPKAEFYLPSAVSAMIAAGEADVHVLPTTSKWFGITYREDRPRVVSDIAALVKAGEYPATS
jgi:UTP-glucose-1-phosphate uridylyltransferase